LVAAIYFRLTTTSTMLKGNKLYFLFSTKKFANIWKLIKPNENQQFKIVSKPLNRKTISTQKHCYDIIVEEKNYLPRIK